ncbi:hypothetical protein pb186bvf_002826 [Paramecium bursaria]
MIPLQSLFFLISLLFNQCDNRHFIFKLSLMIQRFNDSVMNFYQLIFFHIEIQLFEIVKGLKQISSNF